MKTKLMHILIEMKFVSVMILMRIKGMHQLNIAKHAHDERGALERAANLHDTRVRRASFDQTAFLCTFNAPISHFSSSFIVLTFHIETASSSLLPDPRS